MDGFKRGAVLFTGGDDAAAPAPPAPPSTTQAPPSHRAHGPRIPPTSVGHRLLLKAGWTEGQGLGAQNQGAVEPVAPAPQAGAAGVGAAKRVRAAQSKPNLPPPPPPPPPAVAAATRAARAAADADRAERAAIARALAREFDDGATAVAAAANPLLTGRRRRGRDENPLL